MNTYLFLNPSLDIIQLVVCDTGLLLDLICQPLQFLQPRYLVLDSLLAFLRYDINFKIAAL